MKRSGETAPLWRKVPEAQRYNLYWTIEYMALRGFHCKKIAEVCGLNEGSVYLACQKLQIRLRDYRDGKGPVAQAFVAQARHVRSTGKRTTT